MGRISENFVFDGIVRFLGTVLLPAGTVGNAEVKTGDPITVDKLQHEHRLVYAQASGSAATAATQAVYRCHGATGRVMAVKAGCVVACVGDATITVDVQKNGTTILTGTISIDSGDAAYAAVDGTLVATPTLAEDDVLTVVVTVDAGSGTLGQGLEVSISLKEDAVV